MTLLLSLSLFASTALAQVQVQINLPVPTITFPAPPPLVVVQPCVQVVEDNDDEIFFVDSWYWVRRDGRWFRTKRHDGGWVAVEERAVPRTIAVVPAGQYRHWRRGRGEPPGQEKKEKGRDKEKRGKHHHD